MFYLFEQTTIPGAFYSLPGNFFPLRELCKDQNKWKSNGRYSVWWTQWMNTDSQSMCNSFCLIVKETCSLALSWWKSMCFLLANSRCFTLNAAFSLSNWEQYLLELIVLFSKATHYRRLPTNPFFGITFFGWRLAFVVFGGGSFCPMISAVPHYYTVSIFHPPPQVVFKRDLLLHLSRE